MAIWDDVITEQEKEKFYNGGMGVGRVGFGERAALLIVDMSYGFADPSYPLGSETGPACVENIRILLDQARAKGVPVFYSTSEWKENSVERGLWKRTPEVDKALSQPKAYEIVSELKPRQDEPVVVKMVPSAFFGTNLVSMLVQKRVDTLILTGMVTSGCIYATAVDGFSNGFRVVIPQEAVADRSVTGHKVSLFNFHMKYGDVLSMDEVMEYFSTL